MKYKVITSNRPKPFEYETVSEAMVKFMNLKRSQDQDVTLIRISDGKVIADWIEDVYGNYSLKHY